MNAILVTGAQGLVGRYFVAWALENGEKVVGIGRSPRCDEYFAHRTSTDGSSQPTPVPAGIRAMLAAAAYEYYPADLLDQSRIGAILSNVKPRAIVHLASGLRDDNAEFLVRTNVSGTAALFDAVSRERIKMQCVVVGSSAAVYGAASRLPISERKRCEPVDLYGVTKHAAEQIGALYARPLGARVCSARIFNIVGPGQGEQHVCGRFAAQAAAIPPGGSLHLNVGDLRPTRDFVDVRDVAQALLILVRSKASKGSYNVCSGRETAIAEILAVTLRCAGLPQQAPLDHTYTRETDVSRSVGSNERIRELGWKPRFTLEQSIAELVRYYRSLRRTCP